MKKIIILIILLFPSTVLANQWVLFERPEQACYDKRGRVVDCGMPKHHYGGGWIQPKISKEVIDGWYEKGKYLLLNLNITSDQAQTIIDRDVEIEIPNTYKIRRKRKGPARYYVRSTRRYNAKDFNARIITDDQAEIILKRWGQWVDPISGVS